MIFIKFSNGQVLLGCMGLKGASKKTATQPSVKSNSNNSDS